MKKFSLIVLLLFVLFPKKNFSTHIVGGEIFYDFLGGGNYKIHMKVYRDCFNGIPPLDGLVDGAGNITPPYFSIYDANFNFVQIYQFPAPSHSNVPPTLNNPCLTPPTGICVEEGIYEMTINLPPLTGGYYIAYQRCCRNGTILNLISPGSVGTTYWEHIPGPEVVAVNSSPRFSFFPPIFICNGYPINFDHSASDPDGDSLAYILCDPFNGLSSACPTVNSGIAGCPTVNTPPPYTPVPFSAPFNGSYPLSSFPAININASTGLLNGVPNVNGQWVVGVCVEEWRNGVLIGIHHRDFQFNVVACPGLVVSAIAGQTTYCFGYNVTFDNQSFNGSSYLWNFGDATTTADTSHSFEPNYTYPAPGNYTVTLIVNPYTPCADTATQTFQVYPLLQPSFVSPPPECITGNSFNFTAGGNFMGGGTFAWVFGPNANPSTSSAQNPTNIVYNQAGIFPVSLTVSENGCTETFVDSVEVYPIPVADFNASPITGCAPLFVQFYDSSTVETPATFFWDFGDGFTSTLQNPTHIYPNVGVYTVVFTITTLTGCVATSTFTVPNMITVNPSPIAGFTATPTTTSVFEPWIIVTDQSSGGVVDWLYVFGEGGTDTVPNPHYTYTTYGNFNLMQIVTNSFGCPDTAYLPIKIIPEYTFWIPNAFTPFNLDNINPIFKPVVYGVEEYEFLIYDRWGELIYETHEINEGWDGTYKGDKVQIDVYVWKIKYRDVVDLNEHTHVGHVTVVR
ncbi:MAG: PKD domain-containing protein [Bacteroidia bacterium]|nr:PKD domain-containing protein [Bacteroidia bacterium]